MNSRPTWFQRFLLPAFAFKAVVIGGGYATGRELAEYFLPAGPRGGLLGIALAALLWSIICALTFTYAFATKATDYRNFFATLLGPLGIVFEIAYFALVILVLAVFGAGAGALANAALGCPPLAGTLLLMTFIISIASRGNSAVETLFKYVSIVIYLTYAVFLMLCLSRFGDRIVATLANPAPVGGDWALDGTVYAGYNAVGAVAILSVGRHFTSRRDAFLAGLLCGPLAMLPAALFFTGMLAFYPEIGQALLPSDTLLVALRSPAFRFLFQAMIFAALLESGTGLVHAVSERIAGSWQARIGRTATWQTRFAVAVTLLAGSIFLADRFGLVTLIARGYRLLAWTFLAIYVLPLAVLGPRRLLQPSRVAL